MIRPYPPTSSVSNQMVHSNFKDFFEECTITQRRPYYSGVPTHQSSQPSQVLLDTNKHCREQANDHLIENSQIGLPSTSYQQSKAKTMIPKFSYESNEISDKRSKSHVVTLRNGRFKAIGNLIRSVKRFQQTIVSKISSINQLNEFASPIRQCQVHPQTWETVGEIAHNLKLINKFVNHAQSGSFDDIKQMQYILNSDPKKHLRSTNDPQHLINQHNKFGQNSLYVACKNGNLNVIQFLYKMKCNPLIKSKVNDQIEESCLEAAIRWNHVQCVQFMVQNTQYPKDLLKKGLSIAENKQIQQLIQSHLQEQNIFQCCLIIH